jgi:hypothetical protein
MSAKIGVEMVGSTSETSRLRLEASAPAIMFLT